MQKPFKKPVFALIVLVLSITYLAAQPSRSPRQPSGIPANVLLQIIRAEDERRWDDNLKKLLADADSKVRKRAALAAGRIGNGGAVPILTEMLLQDRDADVRQMAAFALGEIESPGGAYALVEVLKRLGNENGTVRARAVEALGKIVAAMTSSAPAPAAAAGAAKPPEDERLDIIRAAIVDTLRFENSRRSRPDRLTILLGLTAVLRAKPDGVGKLLAEFLDYSDPRIVADALNTLARLRLKDGNDKARELLVKHSDPIVRANAARVLGATEDKQAFDALLDRALYDSDLRVRVSAIRALGSLKDERAAQPLVDRAVAIARTIRSNKFASWLKYGRPPSQKSELLDLVTSVGNIEAEKGGYSGPNFLDANMRRPSPSGLTIISEFQKPATIPFFGDPEYHVAAAKIRPADYMSGWPNPFPQLQDKGRYAQEIFVNWRYSASIAQGLRTITTLNPDKYGKDITRYQAVTQRALRAMLDDPRVPTISVPDVLTSYNASKADDVSEVLQKWMNSRDVIIRSTAAELLGNLPSKDAHTKALIDALPRAMRDLDNDAALAILDALAKQKNKEANEAIKTALNSKDHLIRRRAVALLKVNGLGDFSDRIGTVQTRNTEADYRRAIARIGKKPTATVVTSKGSFTIEFLPEDASLTVDNFIQLAKKGFFNGQTIPRVVSNFVVQAGDPRGDQNGGPGYTIRCEINEVPYERAAVGMALSGKDTGGSQWFVTHSPQPHLDGGYTVFGRVIRGMEVIDQIARGDRIVRVVVNER